MKTRRVHQLHKGPLTIETRKIEEAGPEEESNFERRFLFKNIEIAETDHNRMWGVVTGFPYTSSYDEKI